jgi:hypothetical protein
MTSPSTQSLMAAFERLSKALQSADVTAYRAITVNDAPPQDALFLHNAQRLRAQKNVLRMARAVVEGEVATVEFDVVNAQGTVVQPGSATFTLEGDGWRLRRL